MQTNSIRISARAPRLCSDFAVQTVFSHGRGQVSYAFQLISGRPSKASHGCHEDFHGYPNVSSALPSALCGYRLHSTGYYKVSQGFLGFSWMSGVGRSQPVPSVCKRNASPKGFPKIHGLQWSEIRSLCGIFANGMLPLKIPLLDYSWLPSSIHRISRLGWLAGWLADFLGWARLAG